MHVFNFLNVYSERLRDFYVHKVRIAMRLIFRPWMEPCLPNSFIYFFSVTSNVKEFSPTWRLNFWIPYRVNGASCLSEPYRRHLNPIFVALPVFEIVDQKFHK